MEVDYIIVGQGLAGSAVAIQLLKRKQRIVVFDEPAANVSSRIAAGLFNPVTGKKMSRTWLADELFPYLATYYREVESMTGSQFFYPMPIYRPFVSVEEQNEWVAKSADPAYRNYVQEARVSSIGSGINDHFGGLMLKQSGYLDTAAYVGAVTRQIAAEGKYIAGKFNSAQVVIGSDNIRYGDIVARRLILCTGIHSEYWFSWLPITPLKGETVTITAGVPVDLIVNRGVYIVPEKRTGLWKVGSTYFFHDSEPNPTQEGRKELERKLRGLMQSEFEVVDHQWGFRPTTPDRRPLIGKHPEHPIYILNGLGTKGVSLAPYFSAVMVHWLENSGALQKEVDIERFKSLYWGSPRTV
ncbi:MAG TPA: FAD-dependent oxidoreductase [Ohtaekwangia sp.]|nr:FAD-dependent oxidoreductase [Ohtaekwangia sp.]